MRFPTWFKPVWWGIMTLVVSLLIHDRWSKITAAKITSFDTALLAVSIVLILMPFFSELTILGLSIKQQVEAAKGEIKQEVQQKTAELREAIISTINVHNQVNSEINNYVVAADTDLERTKQNVLHQVKVEVDQDLTKSRLPKATTRAGIPDGAQTGFALRYQLETELGRLTEQCRTELPHQGIPLVCLVRSLERSEVLTTLEADALTNILGICNRAIHGEPLTHTQADFMNTVGPTLLQRLRALA